MKRGGPFLFCIDRTRKPENADSLTIMCLEYFALGNLHVAEEACSEALTLDPNRVDALKLRGYVYLLERRYEEAGSDFRAGLRIHPTDDQLFGGLGQNFSNMGDYKAAAGQFHKAVALAPRKAAYWNGLCWAQAASGEKLDEALQACDRAIRLEPDAAAPYNSRGLVKLRMRRFLEAVADYTHSLQANPEQPAAQFGRGLARMWAANKGGASDILAARRMDPDIDGLFVEIGILPDRCESRGKISCPPGFPRRSFQKGRTIRSHVCPIPICASFCAWRAFAYSACAGSRHDGEPGKSS